MIRDVTYNPDDVDRYPTIDVTGHRFTLVEQFDQPFVIVNDPGYYQGTPMNDHIQQAADVLYRCPAVKVADCVEAAEALAAAGLLETPETDACSGLNKLAYDLALASHNYRFPNNTNDRPAWEDSPELRAADVDAACIAWLSARNVQPPVTPEPDDDHDDVDHDCHDYCTHDHDE